MLNHIFFTHELGASLVANIDIDGLSWFRQQIILDVLVVFFVGYRFRLVGPVVIWLCDFFVVILMIASNFLL